MPKKLLLCLLVLACLATIFMLSSQPAAQSNHLSKSITSVIATWVPAYQELPQEAKGAWLKEFNEVVRSLAHFSLFLLLGAATALFLNYRQSKHPYFWTMLFCAIYAVVDELHQEFFSAGRGYQFVDLCKDWSGSLLGIAVIWLLLKIKRMASSKTA